METDILVDARLFGPDFYVPAHYRLGGKCKHRLLRFAALRQPQQCLCRKQNEYRLRVFVHHYRHIPPAAVDRDVAPAQIHNIADAQTAVAGKQKLSLCLDGGFRHEIQREELVFVLPACGIIYEKGSRPSASRRLRNLNGVLSTFVCFFCPLCYSALYPVAKAEKLFWNKYQKQVTKILESLSLIAKIQNR